MGLRPCKSGFSAKYPLVWTLPSVQRAAVAQRAAEAQTAAVVRYVPALRRVAVSRSRALLEGLGKLAQKANSPR